MALEPIPAGLTVLSGEVIDAALKVHRLLGPGLLESVYERCLCRELLCRGIPFRSQLDLPILYDGFVITAQLLTYLRLSSLRLGLLLNFNVPLLRDGIRRIGL